MASPRLPGFLLDPRGGPAAAPLRVLFAYGLLGEAMARLAPLGVDYMGAQLAWLRGQGAEAQVLPLPTTTPVAENAQSLAAAILAESRPCLLVAHSKGGLEALAALLDPEVAARCAGLIAIQSPFYGSPVADALLARPGLHRTLAATVRLMGLGSGAALPSLSCAARQDWMRDHASAIEALMQGTPVLCLAGDLRRDSAIGPDRRYLPLMRWMERKGAGPNDGLVSVRSALLPGAAHWVLPAGHRGLVSTGKGRDPIGTLSQALTRLGLNASPN